MGIAERKPRFVRIALASIAIASACARTQSPRSPLGAHPATHGMASFYSDALRGRRTASGERYDPDALTCAHRTLAFGTRVEVIVKRTGASAVCRINDRGPYVGGRIIDVSHAMARRLGISEGGIAEVDLRVVD
jgi:peptidoglycan lytic transglycosylase